jgi:hypothetical protein
MLFYLEVSGNNLPVKTTTLSLTLPNWLTSGLNSFDMIVNIFCTVEEKELITQNRTDEMKLNALYVVG